MEKVSEKSSNWQIKAGAIMSYVAIIVNILAGFVYTPWMLDVIGDSNYGLYTLATSLISLFVMDFGISAATARHVARYRAQGETEKINNFLGIVYKLYIIIDVIIALIFLVIYFNVNKIYDNLTVSEIKIFKNILVIVIFYNLLSFPFTPLTGILNAYEKFFPLKLVGCLNKILTVVITIIALALGGGIYHLVFIHVICNLVMITVRYILVKRLTPVKSRLRAWDKGEMKSIFTFSMWATIVGITSRLIFNITPSILAMFVSSLGVTIFGLASTLEGYVFMFSEGVNGLFLSKTTNAALSKNREKDTLSLMTRIGRINLSIVALIIVGFFVAGKEFVSLWLGNGYELVYYSAIIIIAPNLIYFPQQIGRTLLVVDGKQKYQALIYLIMGIVNIIISFILIPFMGVLGSAISISVVYCLRFILMSVVFHKKLGVNMFSFYYNCYIKMLLPIIITAVLGVLIFYLIASASWLLLIVKCVAVGIIYVILMWFLAWNKPEKELLTSPLKKLYKKLKRSR